MSDRIYPLYKGWGIIPTPHIRRRTRRDSNPQPADSKSDALSIELRVRGDQDYNPSGCCRQWGGLL